MGPRERRMILIRAADIIERDMEHLVRMESSNNGQILPVAQFANIDFAKNLYRYYSGRTDKSHGHMNPIDGPFLSYSQEVPVGVCAAVLPFNFPFLMAALKVGPALATGCTLVIKPCEKTPMTALKLAAIFQEAGLPDGVLNVVNGDGETTGTSLVTHPLVDKVAFTGSAEVG